VLLDAKRALRLRTRARDAARWLREKFPRHAYRAGEMLKYAGTAAKEHRTFFVVSSERGAGADAIRCLQSVYDQRYPRAKVRHVYIDDASPDDTDGLIRRWLAEHPDHNVDYIRTAERAGGSANNLRGFRMAPPGSVVCELNGDDRLPDASVIRFLNKVYQSPQVWITCNTLQYPDGSLCWALAYGFSRETVRQNAFRSAAWGTHLHTFRRELLDRVPESYLLDPQTGRYWECADDVALYLAMYELAGTHVRHIYRPTYVYREGAQSERQKAPGKPQQLEQRIRAFTPLKPLERL
jgi:glycosyltransferase involved in cell wall biosynthesis